MTEPGDKDEGLKDALLRAQDAALRRAREMQGGKPPGPLPKDEPDRAAIDSGNLAAALEAAQMEAMRQAAAEPSDSPDAAAAPGKSQAGRGKALAAHGGVISSLLTDRQWRQSQLRWLAAWLFLATWAVLTATYPLAEYWEGRKELGFDRAQGTLASQQRQLDERWRRYQYEKLEVLRRLAGPQVDYAAAEAWRPPYPTPSRQERSDLPPIAVPAEELPYAEPAGGGGAEPLPPGNIPTH